MKLLSFALAVCLVACGGDDEPVPPPAGCGDGMVNEPGGEACDDGNLIGGDGCSATCLIEPTGPDCGDEVVDEGEECDDGNTLGGDGCSPACMFEPTEAVCGNELVEEGEDCDVGGANATCDGDCTFAVCGDGTANEPAGEACDDGNTVGGDGCSAKCRFEPS
jgi:cysteine-rich repeat protein